MPRESVPKGEDAGKPRPQKAPSRLKKHVKTPIGTGLGRAIKLVRKDIVKISGSQAGLWMGLDKSHFSHLEKDEEELLFSRLTKLCEGLEVRHSVLLVAAECFTAPRPITATEMDLLRTVPSAAARLRLLLDRL